MFISCYSPEIMDKMSLDDVVYVVGLLVGKIIVKPPRCKVDGDFVYIDEYSGYYQCENCGRFGKLYIGKSLDDFSEWRELDDRFFR